MITIPSLSPQMHLIIQCLKEFQNGISGKPNGMHSKINQCIIEITPDLFNDAEDKMVIFSSTLLYIAANNIPKTSPFPKRKAKPWFDEDCQAAKKERNKANILANKHPSAANSMWGCPIQAGTKKLFEQKKRDTWKMMCLRSMLISHLRRFGIWYVK